MVEESGFWSVVGEARGVDRSCFEAQVIPRYYSLYDTRMLHEGSVNFSAVPLGVHVVCRRRFIIDTSFYWWYEDRRVLFTPVIVDPLVKDAVAESSRRPRIRVLGERYWEVSSAGAYRPVYVPDLLLSCPTCSIATILAMFDVTCRYSRLLHGHSIEQAAKLIQTPPEG